MGKQTADRSRRVRRSTQVIRKLERARERNNRQLAEARIREQRVDQALRDYFAATERIEVVERTYQEKIAQVEARIRQLRADCAAKVADVRAAQAWALVVIHGAGRTVKQVADLVDLSEKATRQLIGLGRNEADGSGSRPETIGWRSRNRDHVAEQDPVEGNRNPVVGQQADHGEAVAVVEEQGTAVTRA